MKPATPLPWNYEHIGVRDMGPDGVDVYDVGPGAPMRVRVATASGDDALYICHAANAYPHLVAALKGCSRAHGRLDADADDARNLLRELGEL